jgi:hypothetical protein
MRFVALALAFPAPILCQSLAKPPLGVLLYEAVGMYQGMPMAPWRDQISIADTVVDGLPSYHVAFTALRPETRSTFIYTATADRGTGAVRSARWENNGRDTSECQIHISGREITGNSARGHLVKANVSLKPTTAANEPVPDFAVGSLLALRRLTEGDTVRLSVFRCQPALGASAIVVFPFTGVVHSAEAPRTAGAPTEPVWRVEGTAGYPMSAIVAKSDRMLLEFTIPEGQVGSQTLSLRGLKKNSSGDLHM